MKYLYILVIGLLFSCSNLEEVSKLNGDLTPPGLISFKVVDSRTLEIKGTEPISLIEESYYSGDNVKIESFSDGSSNLEIYLTDDLIPGKEYTSEFKISDDCGNTLSFITYYYGYNPNKAEILINEFTVEGSDTNPDKVELYVTESGNTAGLTIFNGSKENYDYRFIFPSIDVTKGDYIVIRTITETYSSECIEIYNLDIENDKKFIPGVRDLRVRDLKFSGTNGVIALYDEPFGTIVDSVVYSKNHNDESKNYRNFGLSATLERIDDIGNEGGWSGTGELIFPDDAIYSEPSTTTRSINRVDFKDSNTNTEWKIVDTGESTFGSPNSKNYY